MVHCASPQPTCGCAFADATLRAAAGRSVQLDAFGVTGYSINPAEKRGQIAPQGWHRDSTIVDRMAGYGAGSRYRELYMSQLEGTATHAYKPPVGVNLLCYLQDMDDVHGPLRFLRQSHFGDPPTPQGEAKKASPPEKGEEILLNLKAGDLCCMHGEMIHSGTVNTSSTIRLFVSTFVCRLGWPHRDSFDNEVVRNFLEEATLSETSHSSASQHLPRLSQVQRFFGQEQAAAAALAIEEAAWAQMIVLERKATNGSESARL
eukprot:SAG31_NODE_4908_length_2873_cov_2.949171_2_plen_261_part_00